MSEIIPSPDWGRPSPNIPDEEIYEDEDDYEITEEEEEDYE